MAGTLATQANVSVDPVGQSEQHGLTSAESAERLRAGGPNTLPPPARAPQWYQLLRQFVHFFALMLWVAGGLAFLAQLPQLGVAIFAVVIVNAGFAFVQEYRAERAADRLRDLLPRRVTVIRDGERREIDAADVVVGDAVCLAAGDRICADMRLDVSHALMVDTSMLTGESVASVPSPGETLFGGTFTTEGEGMAIVTSTGQDTRLAAIAALTRGIDRPQPPLARELHNVVRTIALIAVCVGVAFFLASLLLGTEVRVGFVFAIGVTVALVPEGLLPTVTLSLAISAQRMADHKALVRRLEAVETLGSTTFICTDKTGTLTMNQMSVVEVWTPAGVVEIHGSGYSPEAEMSARPEALVILEAAALVAARCSNGRVVHRSGVWEAQGDPMEAAIDVLARRLGLEVARDERAHPERGRFPFDPRRRCMSVVTSSEILVKGAPDAIMEHCRPDSVSHAALTAMSSRGLRVLAVARRRLGEGVPLTPEEAERDLELLALLGFEDPPRPEAAASIAACRRAGIQVSMVTGDHPLTAVAIAEKVGLAGRDPVALIGADLPRDPVALGDLIDRDGVVIARVEPEQKLLIARALRARGHVLAMTGDGVNDGPALQEADIGVAMGRTGTDVAREAADLVLLDDNFATIVSAIEQGRAVFANVQRFLTYHLTDNVAELTPFLVWALSGGRFPLALGVMQILALDLGTDTFSAVALGAEAPSPHTLESPPIRGRLLDGRVARRAFGLMGPLEAFLAMFAFVISLVVSGWRVGTPFPTGAALLAASGATFATVVVAQTANAFACRSSVRTPAWMGWFSNRLLVAAASIELVIAAAFLLAGPIARPLEHATPTITGWLVALSAAPLVLVADAAYKMRVRRRLGIKRQPSPTPHDSELAP